jgi:hypothetical protein
MQVCEACGGEFDAPKARFCQRPECKRMRSTLRKRSERRGAVVALPPSDVEARSNVEVTRAALVAADRLDSPAGVNALTLAARLDSCGTDTGSAVAALSKQHLAALDAAVSGATRVADPVDELRQRREKRLARAGS